MRLLEKSFALGLDDEILDISDFQSLIGKFIFLERLFYGLFLELICPDFPEQICIDVYQIIENEEIKFANILPAMRFRLFFLEFVDRAKKVFDASESDGDKRKVPQLELFLHFLVLETLSTVAGNLRDSFKPSPKIYSLKEHVPNLKTEKTQRAWELFHLLSNDEKVVSLIDSFEFDNN